MRKKLKNIYPPGANKIFTCADVRAYIYIEREKNVFLGEGILFSGNLLFFFFHGESNCVYSIKRNLNWNKYVINCRQINIPLFPTFFFNPMCIFKCVHVIRIYHME